MNINIAYYHPTLSSSFAQFHSSEEVSERGSKSFFTLHFLVCVLVLTQELQNVFD